MNFAARSEGSRLASSALSVVFAGAVMCAGAGCTRLGSLPRLSPAEQEAEPSGPEQVAIEQREICVGSNVESVGKLADVLYYRATMLPGNKLVVGYYAFFSEERPWGNNWLTWTLLPAVAVDMLYTRAIFVGPGLQRAISGKGDVEGFRITYDIRPDGTLKVEGAVADDGVHNTVQLSAADVLAIDPERPTFYSDVWSHQLGGRGVRSMADLSYVRCFGPGRVRPLPDSVDREYALVGRAPPAHVEALGGRLIGAPDQRSASTITAGNRMTPKRKSARFSATRSDE